MFGKGDSGFSSSFIDKEVNNKIDGTKPDSIVTGNMSSSPCDNFKSFVLHLKKEAEKTSNGATSSLSQDKGVKTKQKGFLSEGIPVSSDVLVENSYIKVSQPNKEKSHGKAEHDHLPMGETRVMGKQATEIVVGASSKAAIGSSLENNFDALDCVNGLPRFPDGVPKSEAINLEKAYSLIASYGLQVSQLGKIAQEKFNRTKEELKEAKDHLKEQKERMDFAVDFLYNIELDIEKLKKMYNDILNSRDSLVKEVKVLSNRLHDTKKLVEAQDKEIYKLKINYETKYLKGFNAALEQVRLLHPETDVSDVDSLKFVKDGNLVIL